MVPIAFLVFGAYDWHCAETEESPCLPARLQFCYLLQGAYSNSCEVSFNWDDQPDDVKGIVGDPSAMKVSWTTAWTTGTAGCPPAGAWSIFCLDGTDCDSGDSFVDLDINGSAFLPRVRALKGSDFKDGHTITLCLCPAGTCLQQDLFTQQVGIVHFFAVNVCLATSSSADGCVGSFSSIIAFYPTRLEVFCPSDLCGDPTRGRPVPRKLADCLPGFY